ncbi:hypothetical protein W97_01799 [Coniosporium apollinis CBS 100218]|uniref:amidase n=1 Tax=Coniosporium apollinis (strain CBS 100218) TaxID=1168221 RepID=R7YL04_CONA1|nr:uncharacterized protein W97_01799 [Coniosporium apollinis CBS 100218]EON62575.1 hypothetical protein W97_01799 [Coniosporium apollinis CBS 100218]
MTSHSSHRRSWQDIAKQAQKHRDETIAAVQPLVPDVASDLPLNVSGIPKELLSEREIEITETAPEDLVELMSTGTITSTEVTTAFLRRAGSAQKLTNCLTELLPARALLRAAELDDYIEKHRRPIGPLHGLPISVKEHISLAGLDCNGGFISWVGRLAPRDAYICTLLWRAGAVFYARTTQPQTLMHLETSSNLYGATVNPFQRELSSGGSSGGEGALLGCRGSCLGVGTDIGGSVRSPAGNCGVYALKPTSYRLPIGGFTATMVGQEHVVPAVGPMSTSLGGVKMFMRAILDQKPWLVEPSCVPFEWREEKSWLRVDGEGRKRLKVGVIWDDGVVRPHPPVTRALKEVVDKLAEVDGIEVVEWNPWKHDLAWEIIASLYFCDAGAGETAAIDASGEPWRPLSSFIIKENPFVKNRMIADVWRLTEMREQYRADYAKIWNDTACGANAGGAVDVILCPVTPGAAPPLDCARYWGYTSQWNLLDYPALVFPVTKVEPEVDLVEEGHEPRNEKDKYNYELYKPEKYRGAPISLQLVARRYEDEKVIEALEYIQQRIDLPFVEMI